MDGADNLEHMQLIQHLQAQVAERTESLTRRQEDLAKKASLEAIAVRIITVITLFYLPATFVGVSQIPRFLTPFIIRDSS